MNRLKPIIEKIYSEKHYSMLETGKKLVPPISGYKVFTLLQHFKIPIRKGCQHKSFLDNSEKAIIDEKIREIVDGLMLGDGFISGRGYDLVLSQSVEHRDWIKLVESQFKKRNFVTSIKNKFSKSTYIIRNPSVILFIQSCDWFQKEKNRWYPYHGIQTDSKYHMGRKILPDQVRITPQSVAHWYMGDGCLCGRSLQFATNSFTKKECKILATKLNKLMEISSFKVASQTGHKKKYRTYYVIRTTRMADIKLITKTLQPYIAKSFAYKIQWEKQLEYARKYHRTYDPHWRAKNRIRRRK
jgi:hypothetical protein